jgi:hypothetical protein
VFGFVIGCSKKVLGVSLTASQTIYAIAMGLLGSSLFLLYNVIGAIREQNYRTEDVPKNLAGLEDVEADLAAQTGVDLLLAHDSRA